MSSFDFPSSPSNGQSYSANGITFVWNGSAWKRQTGATKGIKGEPGATGPTGPQGPAGSGGSIGPTGPTGPSGGQGSAGDKGQKGETGGGAPVGQIIAWSGAYNSLPSGYLICDGSAISRTTYAALFAVVGTTHGSGNGSTTFNLPDLQSKFITGASSDPNNSGYSVGAEGGADTVTLTVAQMPSHKHTTTFDNKKYFPGGGSTSVSYGGAGGYPADTFSMSNEGGGQSHENRPPYYALCYIIQFAQGGTVAKGQKGEAGTSGTSTTINSNADNRIITGSATANELNAETNFTYDGSNAVLTHSNGQIQLNASDGSIELVRNSGDAFIDFKNSTSDDYDVRIAQNGTGSGLQITGDLDVTGTITGSLAASVVKQVREAASLTQSSAGTTYTDKVTLTMTVQNNSRVLIISSYELASSTPFGSGNNTTAQTLKVNGSFVNDTITNAHNGYFSYSGSKKYDIFYDAANGAGSRSYKIQFKRTSSGTAYIRNARILGIELGIGP